MKILYLSCHSILEYDEIRIFSDLGYEVFSHGAYSNPRVLTDQKRPPLPIKYYPKFHETTIRYSKDNLYQGLIDWADVIIVVHIMDWVINNWERIKKKKVILRTIGQSTMDTERLIRPFRKEGLLIVRYSPYEKTIPGYNGEDTLIRFGKYPEDFKEWRGGNGMVITFGQSLKHRDQFCNFSIFEQATRGFKRKVYGPNNEDLGNLNGGCLDYETLLNRLSESEVFFFTGTYPASYTLTFVESAMAGLPTIALGESLGNSPFHPEQRTYEVASLLKRYDSGLIGDTIDDLRKGVEWLLNNKEERKRLSKNIKNMSMEIFNAQKIKIEWKKFLEGI